MNVLEIKDLHKYFGSKEVLRGIHLEVPEHSIFGFIGANGAGKTTTMKAVLGLLQADRGEIFVNGEKVAYGQTKTNCHIGYLPDVPEFYGFMTAREYLDFCGKIGGTDRESRVERTEELLALVGLSEEKHRIKGFSRGQKQRLGIAQALYNRPKLLICDEPTSALDPAGRKEILDILQSVCSETTVLFSTHILSDVERICTDVALLHQGEIAMSGKLSELQQRKSADTFHIQFSDGGELQVKEAELAGTIAALAEANRPIQTIQRQEASLEDLFLEVIQC